MSRSFAWRPVVPEPPPGGYIGMRLWDVLLTYQGFSGECDAEIVVDRGDLDFLRGIVAALPKGSGELLDDTLSLMSAIHTHDGISITVEH